MNKKIGTRRRHAIAAENGINEQYLYQCLRGLRDMRPELAVQLEKSTGGEISRFMVVQRRGYLIWPELADRFLQTKVQEVAGV